MWHEGFVLEIALKSSFVNNCFTHCVWAEPRALDTWHHLSARRNTETTVPLVCAGRAQGQPLLRFCQRLLSLELVWKGQFGAKEMAGSRERDRVLWG